MIYPLIFDIDGTLWNACASTAKAWTNALKETGIDQVITLEQIESVAGNPNEVCIETLMPGLCEKYPTLFELLEMYEKKTIGEEGGIFYEGAIEGIKELAKSRQVFLVSNCQDWYMERFLEDSELREVVMGYDCHGMSGKTKSEMLKNMKKKYNIKQAVYIGDTTLDQKAAASAEMGFIRAGWGFGDSEGFERATRSFGVFEEVMFDIISR